MKVAISRIHFPVTALGPGRRLAIWFQGCSIRCPGCISRDTWNPAVGVVPLGAVERVMEEYVRDADGLTVSGGEPFDQPEALAALLLKWRKISRTPTLVFTGREFPEIAPWLRDNPNIIDAVISGPFRSDLPQTLALRGSDNQELHVLTQLGEDMREYERVASRDDRRLDVIFDDRGAAWMAGIPARGDFARLRRALALAGHQAITSDMHGIPSE